MQDWRKSDASLAQDGRNSGFISSTSLNGERTYLTTVLPTALTLAAKWANVVHAANIKPE
jgi:hypothetical protein